MARKEDKGYLGDDREGRVNYNKFKEAEKLIKGPEYKNLLQQFMASFKNLPKRGQTPNELKKAALKKAAAKRAAKKSIIPPSPTR
jgi:hypothetical protein